MALKLIERGPGPGQKREILVTKDEFLIGRGTDSDLRLNAGAVSRHHCLLHLRADEVTVNDLGSSNGTFVNGQRVRSQAVLHHGDQLRVGSFDFEVEISSESAISWCIEEAADQGTVTRKLSDIVRPPREAHPGQEPRPPGQAGNPAKQGE
jgi:pSer/pThr/pTyr-binding forkhead associated (FHA) protein